MLGATFGERAAFASSPGGRYRVDGSGEGGTWPGGGPVQGRRAGLGCLELAAVQGRRLGRGGDLAGRRAGAG